MDKIIIAPHSIVDIITNSSTVIYTSVQDSALDAVRGIINEVLKASGSDLSVDDLYDITVIDIEKEKQAMRREDYASDEEYWMAYDELDDINLPEQVFTGIYSMDASVHTTGAVIVSEKNGESSNITELLGQIFSVTEEYM